MNCSVASTVQPGDLLVAERNFGCGSSREAAVWSLLQFGIRCVIAPSFADIFHNNPFKNGILPVRLPREVCDQLMEDAALGGNARLTVDLARQVVIRPSGEEIPFEIDAFRKHLLLNGLDDIGQTMQRASAIDAFGPAWIVSGGGIAPAPAPAAVAAMASIDMIVLLSAG